MHRFGSYALEISVNGVTCLCSLLQIKKHLKFINCLNKVDIHVSTKIFVTGEKNLT